LGIDDHFASILQNIFIVYGIRLRIVECPVRVVGMSRRLGVYESGVIGGLPVRTRAVRRGRGWEWVECMFLVEVLSQSNHSLPREDAENRSLVLGELWGSVTAVHLEVISQESLDSGQAEVS
jgi:hypothetical protein